MEFSHYSAFALALAIAVALPGPGIISVTSCAIGRGLPAAGAMIVGIILGDLIFFLLAVLGMAALARSMGELFLVVKILGAAYLVWLGLKLWRAPVAAPGADGAPIRRGFLRNLVGGLGVTLGNPKAIAFYAGLLPTFVNLETITPGQTGVMALIVVALVGLIPLAYALAAARARRLFADPRRQRVMNRTAGTMMVGAGVAVATN